MPPLTILRGTKPGRWSVRDRILATALFLYERSMHKCGHPTEIGFNPDMLGWPEVRTVVCAFCAAIEEHQRSDGKPVPGEQVYVVDGRPPGHQMRPWKLGE